MSRVFLHRIVFFMCIALCTSSATRARADFLLWEENADDEWHHRSFAATGYLAAGFLWRQNDPQSPSSDDQFIVQHARFGFRALLHKWAMLRFEIETSPSPSATDVFIDSPISPMFGIRFGQFRLPFLRMGIFSETSISFIDRPLFTPQAPDRSNFGTIYARDIGLMFSGTFGNREPALRIPSLQYAVGAFLGRGANQIVNDDNAFLYAGRLSFHVFGAPVGIENENDLAHNEIPRVALGGGAYTNCSDRGDWNRGWTVDSEFRYRGFFASLAFVRMRSGGVNGSGLGKALGYDDSCGVGGTGSVDSVGWGVNAQVQYVLPPVLFPFHEQSLEVLTRFDAVSPNGPADGSFFGGGVGSPGYTSPNSYVSPDNAPSTWRITFGLNWYPTSQQILHLTLNYQINRETEHAVVAGTEYVGIRNDILWLQLIAGM
ncbi:MAG: hypothetical protein IPK60_24270 [Sandaracinaceae bacterium]|nr:hypothetical protein [Sandaracinaceae bacterium]